MTKRASALLVVVAACAVVRLSGASARPDPSPHALAFVGVDQDVALEVLDWGGTGAPLVLLAGLGNTAHVFDEFALRFNGRFHVYGITRRGYGASGRPSNGYDIGTLAHDILTVCDALHLDRVILAGHSLAGDELTTFASRYASRARALVYLDAAYDRTNMPTEGTPPEQPRQADLLSIASYGAFVHRTRGMKLPDAELRQTVVVDAEGRVIRGAVSSDTPQAILRGLVRPDYPHVVAPALAIFRPPLGTLDRNEGPAADGEAFVQRSIEQFRRGVAKGRVVRLATGSHYLFLTNEDEVVRLMQDFLAD